jgi:hypothetical protein
VFLLRIDVANAAGEYRGPEWMGEMPMQWRGAHNQADLSPRTVGRALESDMVGVFRDGGLRVLTLAGPSPLDKLSIWPSGCKLRLFFEARGAERDSPTLAVEVIWNGKFSEADDEMAHNNVVREVNAQLTDA